MKARRRLPLGLQTFRELREEDCYYVDKTGFIALLLDEGKHYFLSRPRRFGKSLFLDTLKELFEGNEALFTGLHIHNRWDWSERHPVVRLDFGGGHFGEPGYVHTNAMAQLAAVGQDNGVAVEHDTAPERLRDLLRALHAKTGRRVVVLVDEYDKPLLDALDTPDLARANRDYLRGLYSTIKFQRRPRSLHASHRSQQEPSAGVREGEPLARISLQGERVLRSQQPDRHHPRSLLLRNLRLYRDGPGHRVRPGAARPGTGSASATGTTVTTGSGTTRSITRSTFCCCSGDSRSGVTRTSTARPVNPST